MSEEIEKCDKETGHAQVAGTYFCRCTHVMYDQLDALNYPDIEQYSVKEFLPPTQEQMIEYLESEVMRLREELEEARETLRNYIE